MQRTLGINQIDSYTKAQMIHHDILQPELTDIECVLRLMGRHSQALMLRPNIKLHEMQFPETYGLMRTLLANPIIVSDYGVADLTAVDRKQLQRALKKVDALPIPEFALQTSNIFKNGFKRHTFYTHDHMLAALNILYVPSAVKKFTFTTTEDSSYAKRVQDIKEGCKIKHPDGDVGLRTCRDLYNSESLRIINICRNTLNFPEFSEDPKVAITPLTYATLDYNLLDYSKLDYDLLDFKKVYNHAAFEGLTAIHTCDNRKHMIDFLMSDGKLQSLLKIASQAQKESQPQDSAKPRKLSQEQQYFNSIPDNPAEQGTVYSHVKYMMENENMPFADFAVAYKRFIGSHYTPAGVKAELEKVIALLKGFNQYSEYAGSVYMRPRDLVLLSGVDMNLQQMIDGKMQKISDMIKHFADTHGSDIYAETLTDKKFMSEEDISWDKFLVAEKTIDGRREMIITHPMNIAKAAKILVDYIADRK